MTNEHADVHRDYSFLIGLLAGGVLGAGAAIFLGPRVASEVKRVTDSARTLRHQAAARYQKATTRVGEAVDDLTAQGRGLRDDVRDAVTRGPKGENGRAAESA